MTCAIKTRRFGDFIRRCRRDFELSQEALANRVGIFQTHLSKIELGQTIPSMEIVSNLARELNTPTCYLFSLMDKCEQLPNELVEIAADEEIQLKIQPNNLVAGVEVNRLTKREMELLKAFVFKLLDKENRG